MLGFLAMLLVRTSAAEGMACADLGELLRLKVPAEDIVAAIEASGVDDKDMDCLRELARRDARVLDAIEGRRTPPADERAAPAPEVEISGLPLRYVLVMGTTVPFSKKVTITIDYGQDRQGWLSDARLKDTAGTVVKFNSMVDVMNYMASQGWEFADAYVITVGNQNVYHYLFRNTKL